MAEYGIRWVGSGTTTVQPCAEVAIETIKSWAEHGTHNELMVRKDATCDWEPSGALPTYDALIAENDRLREELENLRGLLNNPDYMEDRVREIYQPMAAHDAESETDRDAAGGEL